MQKFLILGTEIFAWNSSHHQESGSQTQTQTAVDHPFRIHSIKLSQKLPLATQLISRKKKWTNPYIDFGTLTGCPRN